MSAIIVRRPLDWRAILLVVALCMVWGFQQVALKSVALAISPVMQLALRFAGASVFFGVWVAVTEGRRAFDDGSVRSGLLLGLLFSLEFLLAGQSLSHTTAARAIVFLYTAPVFTALGLQFLPEERLTRGQWFGLAVAFCGILVAFLGSDRSANRAVMWGDTLALAGGLSWGLSNVVLRRGRVGGAGTAKTVLYQVATASVVLATFALSTGQGHLEFTPLSIAALCFHTLVIAVASYLLWFWLLRHYLTSRLMMLSLLTPLFGVVFGAALLGDPIGLKFALGTALVLAGVLVVNLRFILQRGRVETPT